MSTPFAAMGVRGTDFWAGAVEGKYGVPVILDQAEEGTYIDPRTGCPGVPRQWTRVRCGAVTRSPAPERGRSSGWRASALTLFCDEQARGRPIAER